MPRDWTRYEVIVRARRDGLTLKAAGALLGVSRTRADQMLVWAVQEIKKNGILAHLAPRTSQEAKLYKYWWVDDTVERWRRRLHERLSKQIDSASP